MRRLVPASALRGKGGRALRRPQIIYGNEWPSRWRGCGSSCVNVKVVLLAVTGALASGGLFPREDPVGEVVLRFDGGNTHNRNAPKAASLYNLSRCSNAYHCNFVNIGRDWLCRVKRVGLCQCLPNQRIRRLQ
jgi:hypothetical protein